MDAREVNIENKKEVEAFIRFPFDLYRDHPLWVPPLLNGVRSALIPASHSAQQPLSAIRAVKILTGPVPAILLMIGVIFAVFYPLTRSKHEEIRRELAARRAGD